MNATADAAAALYRTKQLHVASAQGEALGLAILAATDRPDHEQDGAERARDDEEQDEYLNGSHLNQLPVPGHG